MFIVSEKILKEAEQLAIKLIENNEDRGEIPFSPASPLVINTDPTRIGKMLFIDVKGRRFYIGFEKSVD